MSGEAPSAQGDDALPAPAENGPIESPSDEERAPVATGPARVIRKEPEPADRAKSERERSRAERRARHPHEVHADLSFVVSRIYWKNDVSYDLRKPGVVAAAEGQTQRLQSSGLGLLASVGWAWRSVGVGAELMHTWGNETSFDSAGLRAFGVRPSATPYFSSVCIYGEYRPFERWLAVRGGVGGGGAALRSEDDHFELDDQLGLVAHLSARASAPITGGVRAFAGAGARTTLVPWEGSVASVLDLRLGLEHH